MRGAFRPRRSGLLNETRLASCFAFGWGLIEQNPLSRKGYYADFRRVLKIHF